MTSLANPVPQSRKPVLLTVDDDPPGEKLCPVIDGLLQAWKGAREPPIPHTKVIGHRWSARSWQFRDFLARNGLYYNWFMADEPAGEQLLQAAGEDGLRLPVVVT